MLWKLTVLLIVLLVVVSAAKRRRPLDKAMNRARIQKFQKQAEMNRVKSFLKRFCEKEEYLSSTVCQTFFKCKCGNEDGGLFECLARECNEVTSFFCDSIKCKTDIENNDEEDECTLGKCETYKETLDVGETAICAKIKFWKTMKDCRRSTGNTTDAVRDACIDQICSDGTFKEECNKKIFFKNISECYKQYPGRRNQSQREECRKALCESENSHEKWCKQMACMKQIAEGSKDCLSDLCKDRSCENPFCKYFSKRNQNVECIDRCG